jgi:hypothetical protein
LISGQTPSVSPENANLSPETKRHVSESGGLKEKVVEVLFEPRQRTCEKQTLQDDHQHRPAQRFRKDVLQNRAQQ